MKVLVDTMLKDKKILAIIPARGGSKGLPGKNILPLGGRPLISWTIEAAHKSQYIDRVILSSDDEQIAAVAKDYACDVPFTRPTELACDSTDSVSVVVHALEQVGTGFDIIILLQPTSPFRNAQNIDAALELFSEKKALSVVSVAALDKSPEWLYRITQEQNTLQPLLQDEAIVSRRQDSLSAYYLNGAIYVFDKNYFLQHKRFIDDQTQAYIMEANSSLDIDTKEDFMHAQLTLENIL